MTRKVRTSKGEAPVLYEGDLAAAERRQRAADTRARARSSKVTDEVVARVCEAIAHGRPRNVAIAEQGVGRTTFYEAIDADADVRARVETAEALGAGHYLDLIATDESDWKRWAWLGERLHPKVLAPAPQKVETTGADGGPVKSETNATITIVRDEALTIARRRDR